MNTNTHVAVACQLSILFQSNDIIQCSHIKIEKHPTVNAKSVCKTKTGSQDQDQDRTVQGQDQDQDRQIWPRDHSRPRPWSRGQQHWLLASCITAFMCFCIYVCLHFILFCFFYFFLFSLFIIININ